MDEYVKRMYLKEEEFLEEFLGTVEALLLSLGGAWQPNYSCNDQVREETRRRLAKGALEAVTFQDAVIFYSKEGFSSIRLYLRSSQRYVVIRIRCVGGSVAVERLADMITERPADHPRAAPPFSSLHGARL
jgi:hypothetical protein